MLPKQLAFLGYKVIGDCQGKLKELHSQNPKAFRSEKRVILTFWDVYEGLSLVLGDKYIPFVDWFCGATSPETITRSLRALKEDGTIHLSPGKVRQRQQRELAHRRYWARTRK